ncbi:MAG: thiolase family protein [Acidimicrobiia bacterium]
MNGAVAITGVGYSDAIGRDTGFSEGQLALQACRAAIADAGLEIADVDGLSMFPHRNSPPSPYAGPPLNYVQRSLGMRHLSWWQAYSGEHAQLGAMVGSMDALAAGRCNHVVCYRAHLAQTRRYTVGGADPTQAFDEDEFALPYGAGGGTARGALWAARYMARHDVSQVELGSVSINGRAHAVHNPRAWWRTPVTIDDYLRSRWISTPLKLLDCDYPIDGAVAVVLSRGEAAASTRAPVWVEATGTGPGPATDWITWPEKSEMAATHAAAKMWAQTALTPSDVDVAEVYDGFSFFTLMWLEALGLAEVGRSGAWLLDGGGQLDGSLPVNTDGGQLGVGRLHGFGKVAQAALQLRGEAPNQVEGAAVAVASAGGGPLAVSMLLTREPRS